MLWVVEAVDGRPVPVIDLASWVALANAPGALRQVARSYTLYGLQEDLPWQRDFAPHFALPRHVERMVQHGFTELLNNAADHSGGTSVTVSLRQTPCHVQLLVSDDGCGVFDRLSRSFDIDDPTLAMVELSKGKLTSLPDRHAGRGEHREQDSLGRRTFLHIDHGTDSWLW